MHPPVHIHSLHETTLCTRSTAPLYILSGCRGIRQVQKIGMLPVVLTWLPLHRFLLSRNVISCFDFKHSIKCFRILGCSKQFAPSFSPLARVRANVMAKMPQSTDPCCILGIYLFHFNPSFQCSKQG